MKEIPLDYCIETERLTLRMSSVEEIDFVWDATRYPGFNDGMLWSPPESRDELAEFAGNIEERWRTGDGYVFTFYDRQANAPRGRIVIEQRCGGWQIGFWTHPKFYGAGYASEALGGLLRFCFEELELKQVSACHAEWNIASRTVLERNGFRFKVHVEEGFEKGGEWIGQDTLTLSRDQWSSMRS